LSCFPVTIRFDKIEIGYGYQYWPRYDALKMWEPTYDNRPIDVHFVGNTTSYGRPEIAWHRVQLCEQLKQIGRNGRKCVWGGQRLYTFAEYSEQLKQSKVVVAPYGYGARTHREIEGFLAGCIVIRPPCHFVESWPELRDFSTNHPDVDWQGLPGAVEALWDHASLWVDASLKARDRILDASTDEAFASRIKGIVERCTARV